MAVDSRILFKRGRPPSFGTRAPQPLCLAIFPSSTFTARSRSATYLRVRAASDFISVRLPLAIASLIGGPYGGTGPLAARLLVDAFFADLLFFADIVCPFPGAHRVPNCGPARLP